VSKETDQVLKQVVKVFKNDVGRMPQRIVIEPNGEVEVNCRVGVRGQTHPRVYFTRVADEGQTKRG
jgi:uncharacterized Zn-finger protein